MHYVSTRGSAESLDFGSVLLGGLAPDGGLYLPEEWPTLDLAGLDAATPYVEVAQRVMAPFVAGSIDEDAFASMIEDAYATFDTPAVTPLVGLDDDISVLELFHGPTLAFKDVALQLVGRLFDYELTRRQRRTTIVGATSGDTGSAAIEACRDRDALDIFILFPEGRVSEVQRRQMTTVASANVHCIAVKGTFDDCQDMVKAMFADDEFRTAVQLGAVNSINWARVMAQVVYYVVAALRLDRPEATSFAVPTGNFGNVFAGWVARRIGLPINRFIVGSNHNDILTRFFRSGELEIETVIPSLSPSMDIQVSSNLERLLFEASGRDGQAIADLMATFRDANKVEVTDTIMTQLGENWRGYRVNDEGPDGTKDIIASVYRDHAMVVDPHTAVGIGAARMARSDGARGPIVTLATAHPAKFPDAVEAAIGERPPLPDRLGDLFERPERFEVLANDYQTVRDWVRQRSRVAIERA